MKDMKEMQGLLDRFAARSREILGENLTGIYLHGSAAMGCFHPEKSDLDLIIVTEDPPSDGTKAAFMEMIMDLDPLGPAKGIEMSVVTRAVCDPFVYPTPFELHYSRAHLERYRRDPGEYIRGMKGTDRDLAAHFTVIRQRGICLWGAPAETVFGPVPGPDYLDALLYDVENAPEEIADNTMYLTLNLARVLAWRREGSVLSKAEGGAWALARLPEEYRPLVREALREYAGGAAPGYDPALARRYAVSMLAAIRAEP